MKIFITGGAGFIGSHAAEFYANRECDVVVFDNLSRAKLMKRDDRHARYNWNYLSKYKNVTLVQGDVRDYERIAPYCQDADVIIHAAAQTAVTTSVVEPEPDFGTNMIGTFNVLEAVRRSNTQKTIIYCSTNKVYGDNVNNAPLVEYEKRYDFSDPYKNGIPEDFSIDHCKHTPYGCSKLAADIYMQEWGHLYGHKTGVFRMSCIYGTRQFGVEDQGWVAWFTIAALKGLPITIYGDGKQVRDVLFVGDLIELYNQFVESDLPHGVFNTGGGSGNTMSLLELLDELEENKGEKIPVKYDDWRPSDQKVYISNIDRLRSQLGWEPKTAPHEGVQRLINWVQANSDLW
ncbi:MAG: hypothetical protein B6244_03410 [Candidatus Cloacimonetes bacterium 4572_55]|nr:MAG: hypothetical protein B6244_03410 [Candidatus Cloacimonetes bacterium 4572_55]